MMVADWGFLKVFQNAPLAPSRHDAKRQARLERDKVLGSRISTYLPSYLVCGAGSIDEPDPGTLT